MSLGDPAETTAIVGILTVNNSYLYKALADQYLRFLGVTTAFRFLVMDNEGFEARGETLPEKVDSDRSAEEVKKTEGGEIELRSTEDEKILAVLREVVRKCTNADPMKRPTAAEVLDMLKMVD